MESQLNDLSGLSKPIRNALKKLDKTVIGNDDVKQSILQSVLLNLFEQNKLESDKKYNLRARGEASKRRRTSETRGRTSLKRKKEVPPRNASRSAPRRKGSIAPEAESDDESISSLESHEKELIDEIFQELGDQFEETTEEPDYEKPKHWLPMHTLITGSSGVGKSTLATALRNVWKSCGFVNDKFGCYSRSDLVSGFIGQSAARTKELLKKNAGGVVFIDEAYSLVGGKNDFGHQVLAEIVETMSHDKYGIQFIFAGYSKAVQEDLMAKNEGLSRRFVHKYEMKYPTHHEKVKLFYSLYRRKSRFRLSNHLKPIIGSLLKRYDKDIRCGGEMTSLIQHIKSRVVLQKLKRKGTLNNEQPTKELLSSGFKSYVELSRKKNGCRSPSYMFV